MIARAAAAVPGAPARLALDAAHPDPGALLAAARILRHGGLVAYPTETVYGLGVDPFSAKAVERLFALKGRDPNRPVILLIPHAEAALDLGGPEGAARQWLQRLARAFWPGPLTLVLPRRPRLECPALVGAATVAVRVSSHPVALQLARSCWGPVTSTSANLSGRPPAASAGDLDPGVATGVDLILDGGGCAGVPESTILDLTGARPALLREGAVPAARIAAVMGFPPKRPVAAR